MTVRETWIRQLSKSSVGEDGAPIYVVREGASESLQKRGKRGLVAERMDLDVEWKQGNSRRGEGGRQNW